MKQAGSTPENRYVPLPGQPGYAQASGGHLYLTLTDAVNAFFQQSLSWTPFYCNRCRSHRLAVPPFGTTSRTRPQIWSAVTSCRSGALL